MAETHRELDHPADLLLEVRGESLERLAENSLFALYDSVVDVDSVEAIERRGLAGSGADPAGALRALLAEALFLFDTEGFVGAAARVEARAETAARDADSNLTLSAAVWGERLDRGRHETKTEVKAVTYHRLAVQKEEPGLWRAVFLLDV